MQGVVCEVQSNDDYGLIEFDGEKGDASRAYFHLTQQFPGLAPELVFHARVRFIPTLIAGRKERWWAEHIVILSLNVPYVDGTVVKTHPDRSSGALRFQLYGSTCLASYSCADQSQDVLPLLVRGARVRFLPVWRSELKLWWADDIRVLGEKPASAEEPTPSATQHATSHSFPAINPATATRRLPWDASGTFGSAALLADSPVGRTPYVEGKVVIQPRDDKGMIRFSRAGKPTWVSFRLAEQRRDLRPLLNYGACVSFLPVQMPRDDGGSVWLVADLIVLKAAPPRFLAIEMPPPDAPELQGIILRLDTMHRYGFIGYEQEPGKTRKVFFHLDNQRPRDRQALVTGANVWFVLVVESVVGRKAIGVHAAADGYDPDAAAVAQDVTTTADDHPPPGSKKGTIYKMIPGKNYGFIEYEQDDGSHTIFFHLSAQSPSVRASLVPGARVRSLFVSGYWRLFMPVSGVLLNRDMHIPSLFASLLEVLFLPYRDDSDGPEGRWEAISIRVMQDPANPPQNSQEPSAPPSPPPSGITSVAVPTASSPVSPAPLAPAPFPAPIPDPVSPEHPLNTTHPASTPDTPAPVSAPAMAEAARGDESEDCRDVSPVRPSGITSLQE
ncbi:hypothetical protein PAPYR_10390 [Paratrimastix pyriformis]|uniref:CSD domain-containing protein n=1 Tax=Paratrimastix pyriformis TaxID=342808 RepID=A0ABQ8U7V8_9EUKA|nr:hypothetical protein PAPYR_10390 [Paratrimastix pyriformis]